jgi:hypothetical protein
LVELVQNGVLDGLGQLGPIHHGTDKQTISLFSGDAAGRCVRLPQIAHLRQGSHFVPDGCRGEIKVVSLHETLGPYGSCGIDIVPDDDEEDCLLSVSKR